MPYIVTTKRELPPGGLPHGEHPHDYGYPAASRRAVATLDEAREWIYDNCGQAATSAELLSLDYESGGTVGPLPDGTIIEVEAVLIENLIRRAGLMAVYVTAARYADTAMSDADVIDAFNAREAAAR